MRDGWTETTLGEVANVQQGRRVDADRGEIPVLGATGTVGSWGAATYDHPAIALGCRGTVGGVRVIRDPAWFGNNVMAVWPKTSESVLLEYLALALSSADLRASGVISGAVQLQITRKPLLGLSISLPPLDEQRRIVDLIAAVDDAVEAAEAEADTAKTARDEMLTAMLAARDGWRETTLGELADVLRGAVWRKSDEVGAPDDQHEAVVGIGVTTAGGVINRAAMKYVSGLGDKAKRLAAGDTLVVMSNGNHSRIGNAYAIPDDFVGMPFSAFQAAVRVRERDVVTPTFLSILLGSEELQQAFTDSAAGSTGLGNLKVTYLRAIPIALPPIDEQRRIVATVKSVDDALDAARATAESLRTLRSTLLTVLLSGEHEIPASYDALLGEVA